MSQENKIEADKLNPKTDLLPSGAASCSRSLVMRHWARGDTGVTNFNPLEFPLYEAAIKVWADDGLVIHYKGVTESGAMINNLWSLHDLKGSRDLSAFWRIMHQLRKSSENAKIIHGDEKNPNHNKSMPQNKTLESPETPTEEKDFVGIVSHDLFSPFYRAAVPTDASSMPEFLASHLAQVAEKLGYREGKEGTTIPPVEWCGDDPLQAKMRAAWARGCKSGLRVRENV